MDITKANNILGKKYSFSAVDTNKVIHDLKLPQNAKILDIGTRIGNLAITLALNGYKVLTGEPSDGVYLCKSKLARKRQKNES